MKVIRNRMRPSAISDDGVEVADGLGELVGDRGRDRGAGRQERGGDLVRVADHEGHRHGLAERAAEAEHDAADHADPRVGDHHLADHLPGRAAEAVGRSLSTGGTVSNTSREIEVMKGSTMMARIRPAVRTPMP